MTLPRADEKMQTTHTQIDPVIRLPEACEPVELPPLQVIEADQRAIGFDGREIWSYRELLYFLIWRDIKVRYKQTILGAAWAVLQPTLSMIIFTIFFGRLAGLQNKTGGIPYSVYVFAGLLPWTFFSSSISAGGNSLIGSANLITKVYFPRLIIPLAAVAACLVDLLISLVVLLAMMVYYRIVPTWQFAWIPLFLFGTTLAAVGVGALFAALTAAYRDFRYVVPFLVQIWMFLTPVIYPSTIVPARWRWLFSLNPMSGLIDGFRGAFLGRPIDWPHAGLGFLIATILLLGGAAYFRTVERRLADII
jgi:homopolymeric O-antigen transport system permease protein